MPSPPPLVLPLGRPGATLELAGGKGASLSRMLAAGLPVPAGFVLTTAAYQRLARARGLQAAVDRAVGSLSEAAPASFERVTAALQPLFTGAALPEEVAGALGEAYAALGHPAPAVAVRSSATAEDLPGASFAGQQETLLNVRGETALLDAVRRCWASLWTARAMAYRQRLGIDQRSVAIAVVVQVMVPAEAAGVLFTANPTTGERSELLVNASFGLGEAVVSGQVTPDSYVVDRATLTTRAATLGAKATMVVPAVEQGTVSQPVPDERRGSRALSEPLLRALAELAIRVEAQFDGVPQDVEWAVADGRCWLLQARPITSLPPAPLRDVRWEPPVPGSKWVRRQVVEHMPDPLSPLFEELYLREGLERSVDSILVAMDMPDVVDELMDRPFFRTINGFAYMRADVRLKVGTLLRSFVQGVPALFRVAVPNWRDRTLPAYLATIERWRRRDPAALSDEALLGAIRELAWADAGYWWASALAIGVAKVSDSLLDTCLRLIAPGRGLTSGRYLRGFPSKSQQAEADLEAVAETVRRSPELRALVDATPPEGLRQALAAAEGGAEVRAGLAAYLDRYGHLIYSLDFAEPTQADDPRAVLSSLKALAQAPGRDIAARQAETVREQEREIARTLRSLGPLRRRLFQRLLRWARQYAPYREEALFYLGAGWPTLRRLAFELGRRLTASGALDAPDDVFYLESGEARAASAARARGESLPDLARLARERRELREALKRLHPPPAVPPAYRFKLGPIDLASRESQRRNAPASAVLRGFAVSPGRVTAPASVVMSPAQFGEMRPGTVLVCPTTTPAWTPLFAQARALVTDIGGILAHGSIVAREYGIPAVMGTGTATQRIAAGQVVTVDGDAGLVTLGS
ncbi:MAG: phosphoenolpyruvate synthase [Chloroflexi bacterium]|nr:phosphoenolpyruvate synthase [Chloroflexota bacterium]